MTVQFDSTQIDLRYRLARWQESISDVFYRLETWSDAQDDFTAKVKTSSVGSMVLAHTVSSCLTIARTPKHIADGQENFFVFGMVTCGEMKVSQDHREAIVRPGEFAVLDSSRPYRVNLGSGNRKTLLLVPRGSILERVGTMDSLTAKTFGREQSLASITFNLVTGLADVADRLGSEAAENLAGRSLDILGLALGERLGHEPRKASEYRSLMLLRLKSFIQTHLSDGELNLSDVASALAITPRSVNKLLAVEGASFRRYLLSIRLERCASILSDPASLHRPVGEIGMACGFNDMAHFSHAFKTRYGLSPREWRQQMLDARLFSH
ncbi:MAG: helix-turn-helix domain-containing protein [Aliidongia sp.]